MAQARRSTRTTKVWGPVSVCGSAGGGRPQFLPGTAVPDATAGHLELVDPGNADRKATGACGYG